MGVVALGHGARLNLPSNAVKMTMLAAQGEGWSRVLDDIVGARAGLAEVMHRVDLVRRSDVPVLLLGETGSGKEVVARALHDGSGRAHAP